LTAQRLRQAVAGGACAQAHGLVRAYGWEVREALRKLSPADPQATEIITEARDLLEWVRRMTLSARARAAAQLAQLPGTTAPYRAVCCRGEHSWELKG
jgi:chemotaxis regulatin CheY-phosphate phosphatase CheZ